ncbi:hypothetical protein [Aliivibrio fischeri]|uniref:hypothetical protein n=1 Tax=Aliivibrio fischeri TaxID=668 RepID=UPI0007C54D03|nr:hypothetical protein [Aliivibrio fischeri]
MIKKYTYTPNTPKLVSIARASYEASKQDKEQVLPCILFCASVLESFINESYEFRRYLPRGEGTTSRYCYKIREYAFEMSNKVNSRDLIHNKYSYALALFSGDDSFKGKEPYESFKVLISIRNEIVHNKPEVFVSDLSICNEASLDLNQYQKFIRQLKSKKVIEIFDDHLSWIDLLQNESVAKWAINVMDEMIALFINSLDEGEYKQCFERYYGESS